MLHPRWVITAVYTYVIQCTCTTLRYEFVL
jgi:hypothetical protein